MKKCEFREATKLKTIWNKVIEFKGLKLATVMWHDKSWKLVKTLNYDDLKERWDNPNVIAEFHTQEELWQYIKNLS